MPLAMHEYVVVDSCHLLHSSASLCKCHSFTLHTLTPHLHTLTPHLHTLTHTPHLHTLTGSTRELGTGMTNLVMWHKGQELRLREMNQ